MTRYFQDGTIINCGKCFNEGIVHIFVPLPELPKPLEEELPHISRYIVIKIAGYLLERGDAQWDKIADSEFDNVIVFNTATMAMATNVYRNGTTDNFVTFPCASSEITEWEAAISDIGKLLFDKAGCYGTDPDTYYPRGPHYWWGTDALWYDEGADYSCYDVDGNLVIYNNTLTTERPYNWEAPPEGCVSYTITTNDTRTRNRVYPRYGAPDGIDRHDYSLTYRNQLDDYYSAFSWALVDDYSYGEVLVDQVTKVWHDDNGDGYCETTGRYRTMTFDAVETRQHTFKTPLGEEVFNGRDTWAAAAHFNLGDSDWTTDSSSGDRYQMLAHTLGHQNPYRGFATESLGGVYDEEESENVLCQFFYRRYTVFNQEVAGGTCEPSGYTLEDFNIDWEDGDSNGDQWSMLHASIAFGKYTDVDARNVPRTPVFENAIEELIETAYIGTDYTCAFEDRIQTVFSISGPDMKDPATIVP